VDPRQVAVEHHHVVGVDRELGRGVLSVIGDVDRHALVAKAFGDVVSETMHVFGDEDSHRRVDSTSDLAAGSSTVTCRPPDSRA
jgi:hypothetical protein